MPNRAAVSGSSSNRLTGRSGCARRTQALCRFVWVAPRKAKRMIAATTPSAAKTMHPHGQDAERDQPDEAEPVASEERREEVPARAGRGHRVVGRRLLGERVTDDPGDAGRRDAEQRDRDARSARSARRSRPARRGSARWRRRGRRRRRERRTRAWVERGYARPRRTRSPAADAGDAPSILVEQFAHVAELGDRLWAAAAGGRPAASISATRATRLARTSSFRSCASGRHLDTRERLVEQPVDVSVHCGSSGPSRPRGSR